jgi:hypothetical protein
MELMTEAQIEKAARMLCKMDGKNPDEQIGHAAEPDEYGFVHDVFLYSPRWALVAVQVRQADRLQVIMDLARKGKIL